MTQKQAAGEPNQNEIGDLEVTLISDTQMSAKASQAWDNGGGTVTVSKDFSIGPDYSKALGADNIIVKAGIYKLNYDKSAYGTATFIVDKK